MNIKKRIAGMSVAWFSFNLATSAIILSSFALGMVTKSLLLFGIAKVLVYINSVIFVIISIAFIIKIIILGKKFFSVFKDPGRGPFMTIISIAIMLLSLDWLFVLRNPPVAMAFFVTGTVLHFIMTVAILYYLIMHENIEVHAMNPGWYMPPVGLILVPYIGSMLPYHISHAFMGIFLGSGAIMWLALFTIWLYRSFFHQPPPGRQVVTMWINLAPPAILPISYAAILGIMPKQYHMLLSTLGKVNHALPKLLLMFSDSLFYTLWGLDGLIFVLVLIITLSYWKRKALAFAESWWAFVFPTAAYTISTIQLMVHHPERWLVFYAVFLYLLTWLLYLITTIKSITYGLREWFSPE